MIRWIDAIIAMTAYAYPRTMPLLGERGVESVTPTADTKHFVALIDKAERRPDAHLDCMGEGDARAHKKCV